MCVGKIIPARAAISEPALNILAIMVALTLAPELLPETEDHPFATLAVSVSARGASSDPPQSNTGTPPPVPYRGPTPGGSIPSQMRNDSSHTGTAWKECSDSTLPPDTMHSVRIDCVHHPH